MAIAYGTRQALNRNRIVPGVSLAVSVNRLGVHCLTCRMWEAANEG